MSWKKSILEKGRTQEIKEGTSGGQFWKTRGHFSETKRHF